MIPVQWLVSALALAFSAGAVNISPNPMYSFDQCIVSKSSLGYCVGASALNKLQSIDNDPAYNVVDGLSFIRDEQRPRTLSNFLERDPGDYGGIFDTMSNVISYRTLRWDMSTLYPGLLMRVTPSVDGVLEFVMDPLQEELALKSSHGQFKELGTARILARQFLLPILLGFKFKVATLVPILFGLLALLAKKALILSKAALVISSSLALGSILFGYGGSSGYGSHSGHHHQNHHFGSHGSGIHHHHTQPSWGVGGLGDVHHGLGAYKSDEATGDFSELMYKGFTPNEQVQDQLKFSPPMPSPGQFAHVNDGRNFAWNDSEKGVKT